MFLDEAEKGGSRGHSNSKFLRQVTKPRNSSYPIFCGVSNAIQRGDEQVEAVIPSPQPNQVPKVCNWPCLCASHGHHHKEPGSVLSTPPRRCLETRTRSPSHSSRRLTAPGPPASPRPQAPCWAPSPSPRLLYQGAQKWAQLPGAPTPVLGRGRITSPHLLADFCLNCSSTTTN